MYEKGSHTGNYINEDKTIYWNKINDNVKE